MTNRRLHLGAWLVLLALGISSLATAAPPVRINNLVTRLQFSPQDKGRIQDYADYWCAQLEHADPGEVKSIRQSLLDPLKTPGGVSEVFRLTYSDALLARLEAIVKAEDPLAAYNAIQVIGTLSTPDGLRVLLEHCDVADEPRFGIRLWVAKSLHISVNQDTLRANDVNRALRRLGLAAGRETDWLVLRRQFELMAAVNTAVSRDVLLGMLASVTERMTKDGANPNQLIDAVFPALKLIRDQFIALPPNDRQTIGKELAPTLVEICDLARTHWDKAQDSTLKDAYGGAVFLSESLLTMITQAVGSSRADLRTALGEAWKQRDKPRFEADHRKWQGFVRQPPFDP